MQQFRLDTSWIVICKYNGIAISEIWENSQLRALSGRECPDKGGSSVYIIPLREYKTVRNSSAYAKE